MRIKKNTQASDCYTKAVSHRHRCYGCSHHIFHTPSQTLTWPKGTVRLLLVNTQRCLSSVPDYTISFTACISLSITTFFFPCPLFAWHMPWLQPDHKVTENKNQGGNSPVVQWLGLPTLMAKGPGLTPAPELKSHKVKAPKPNKQTQRHPSFLLPPHPRQLNIYGMNCH